MKYYLFHFLCLLVTLHTTHHCIAQEELAYHPVAQNENYTNSGQKSAGPLLSYDSKVQRPKEISGFGWEFSDLFEEVEMFENKSFIVHLGTSFVSDLAYDKESFLKLGVPAVHLLMEKSVAKNFGVGLKLGTKWWRAEKLNYNYRYYAAGLRATYHLCILDKLDPYFGANLTARGFWIGNGETSINEIDVKVGAVIGARYYLNQWFGVFGEFAEDGIGKIHIGLTLKLK